MDSKNRIAIAIIRHIFGFNGHSAMPDTRYPSRLFRYIEDILHTKSQTDKGMVRSDISKPALIFFHCKSTHNKIQCENFSC
jgi:hypothetical protein